MMVKDNGSFVRSKPYMTPIHEIIHIGVEQIIVKKYKLNQPEKERLVDLMVKILFSKLIPEYEVQSFGEIKIEPFVDTQTIGNLPKAIQQYVNIYPR